MAETFTFEEAAKPETFSFEEAVKPPTPAAAPLLGPELGAALRSTRQPSTTAGGPRVPLAPLGVTLQEPREKIAEMVEAPLESRLAPLLEPLKAPTAGTPPGTVEEAASRATVLGLISPSKALEAQRSIRDQMVGLAEFGSSPLGVATGGLGTGAKALGGVAEKIITKAIAGGYAIDTLRNLIFKQVPALVEKWDQMSSDQKWRSAVDTLGMATLAGLLTKHALTGLRTAKAGGAPPVIAEPPAPPVRPEQVPPPEPAAAALTKPRVVEDYVEPEPTETLVKAEEFATRGESLSKALDSSWEAGAHGQPMPTRAGLEKKAGRKFTDDEWDGLQKNHKQGRAFALNERGVMTPEQAIEHATSEVVDLLKEKTPGLADFLSGIAEKRQRGESLTTQEQEVLERVSKLANDRARQIIKFQAEKAGIEVEEEAPPAAKPKAPEAPKPTAILTPALLVNGEAKYPAPGGTHADSLKQAMSAPTDAEYDAAKAAHDVDANHVFLTPDGKPLTREEAAAYLKDKFGVDVPEGKLQSEWLNEFTAKRAEAKPAEPSPVTPAPAKKPLPPTWRVSVQKDTYEGQPILSVQIDHIENGKNVRSYGPETAQAAGFDVPDFSKLDKGTYTVEEAMKKLGEKPTAPPPKSPAPAAPAAAPVVSPGAVAADAKRKPVPAQQQVQEPKPGELGKQKKWLLAEIQNATAQAPEEPVKLPENPRAAEAKADLAVVNAVPEPPNRYGYSPGASPEYTAALKAHDEAAMPALEPLLQKYGVEKDFPAWSGYKNLEGTFTNATEGGPKPFDYLVGELRSKIEEILKPRYETLTIEVPGDGTFEVINSKRALKTFAEMAKRFPTTSRVLPGQQKPWSVEPPGVPKVETARTLETDFKAILPFRSTDESRRVLGYVLSDGKKLVATDGRRLMMVERKGPGTEAKPKLLNEAGKPETDWGETQDKKGKVTKNPQPVYPNYKQVIPNEAEMNDALSFRGLDTERALHLVRQAEMATTEKSNSLKVYIDDQGRFGLSSGEKHIHEYATGISETSKPVVALNATYLREALEAARRFGSDKVDLLVKDELSPIVIKGKGWKHVLMPMRLEGEKPTPPAAGQTGGEIKGMGGAVPAEFEHSPQTATGIRNALVDQERAQRGLPAAIQPARRAFGEVWDKAMALIDRDPAVVDRLIDELRQKPRALTDTEDAMLLHRQIDLQNEYGKATRDLAQAFDDGRTADVEQEKARVAGLSDRLLDLYDIGKRAGTETARGLSARRMMAYEDFTLAKMELEKRAANGGRPLTDAERGEITRLQKQIETTQKAYDDYVARSREQIAKLEADAAMNRLKAEGAPKPPTFDKRILDYAERVVVKMETAADAARARLMAKWAEPGATATLDVTMIDDFAIIGSAKIARLGLDLAKWTDAMVKDFGERFRPIAAQIWEASNKKLDDVLKAAPEPVKRLVKKQTPEENKRAIAQSIKAKIEKGKKDEIAFLVRKLARVFYEEGVTEREAMVDALHGVLPELTREQVRDAFSGYGDYKQLSKDSITVALRGMKGELQQIAKLEAMAAGEPPLKSGLERRTPTETERKLIKLVNDAKYKFQVPVDDPNTQLKSALDTLKTTLRNRITDYEERLAKGDFAARPRRELVLDRQAMELKAEAEKVKRKWRAALLADQLKNRSTYEKTMDTLARWRRGFVLSGFTTLGKLTSAAIQRMSFTPTEEVIGLGLQQIPGIRGIAARAPREGGLSVTAEVKAITAAVQSAMKDSWQVLKTGRGALDYLFGTKETYLGELNDAQRSIVDFFGHLHGALKIPVKQAEWARSFQKRVEWNMKQGVDVTDPLVQARMGAEAYRDANRAIFLQDNFVSDRVNRFIRSFEERQKATGKPTTMGKAAATLGRVLLPITKVPTNIVAETIQYTIGAERGILRAIQAIRRGTENLKPEEADLIMRDLKKGAIGSAFLLIGYFAPDVIGGYYQPGEKRPAKDVKPGHMKLYGVDVPSFVLHNPLLETLQVGATIRRVADSKLRKRDTEDQGIPAGILAGALGLTEQVPFIREMLEIVKAWNPRERDSFFGELTKSIIVPQGAQQIAAYLDKTAGGAPVKRKPVTFMQHIESGIPGLREEVPKAKVQPQP